jgi:hypothetical protein
MSDTSQGPGWWLASDGKWYPPELWTGPPESRPQSQTSQGIPPDPGAAPYPDSADNPPGGLPGSAGTAAGTTYGSAPGTYPGEQGESQYPQDPQYPQYPSGSYSSGSYGGPSPSAKTNGLAVTSLVCSCVGILLFTLPCILGVIFGFVARSQIRRSQGAQKGDGLALAGIIVGFAGIALLIILVVVSVANQSNSVIDGSLSPTAALFGL